MYKIQVEIHYNENDLLLFKECFQTVTKGAIRITGITIGATAGFSAGMFIGVNSFEKGDIPATRLHEYEYVPREVAVKSILHLFNSVGTALCVSITGGVAGYKLSNRLISRLFG